MTDLLRLPRLFFDDHAERCADLIGVEDDYTLPVPVRETKRFVWVHRDDPGMADLLDDARHYAAPDMARDLREIGAIRYAEAARRLLAAVA